MCPSSPLTTEYSQAQLDSARVNLEMFAKRVKDYMEEHGEWEVCGLLTTQSALPHVMSPAMGKSKPLGIPVTQNMASLLSAILEQTDDFKKSSANRVLHIWPAHYEKCRSFVTKKSNHDRDTLQMRDPKLIQNLIDKVPRWKALQAMVKEKSPMDSVQSKIKKS